MPDAVAMKELLGLLIEEVKDNLLISSGTATLLLQGEGQALTKLMTMVTRTPPSITPKGDE